MKLIKTVLVDINLCVEEPLNPRFISEDFLKALADKIVEEPDYFGAVPCLAYFWKEKYYIYSGAQRLKAAKLLGLKKIPVRVAEEISSGGKINTKLLKSRILKANEEASKLDYEIMANVAPIDYLALAKIPEVSDYIQSQYTPIPEEREVIGEAGKDDGGGIVGITLEYDEDEYLEIVGMFEEGHDEEKEETISEFILNAHRLVWKK